MYEFLKKIFENIKEYTIKKIHEFKRMFYQIHISDNKFESEDSNKRLIMDDESSLEKPLSENSTWESCSENSDNSSYIQYEADGFQYLTFGSNNDKNDICFDDSNCFFIHASI